MKRLDRDGHITVIRRPKDEPYLYMPNPTLIHPESSKTRHFLAIADFYIRIGQPEKYEVEPYFDDEYRPDAYTVLAGEPILVEIQRSHISHKTMQGKVDGFVRTFQEGKHAARKLWIVSDETFRVTSPDDFTVEQIRLRAGG